MSTKPKILVVDDEARFSKTMCRLLRMKGLPVSAAASGRDALERLKREAYDVVLLDVKMPEMNGVEALAEIKKIQDGVEVIVLTGYASVDTAVEITQRGGYDYLLKPCPMAELLEKIDRAYERKLGREKRRTKAQDTNLSDKTTG